LAEFSCGTIRVSGIFDKTFDHFAVFAANLFQLILGHVVREFLYEKGILASDGDWGLTESTKGLGSVRRDVHLLFVGVGFKPLNSQSVHIEHLAIKACDSCSGVLVGFIHHVRNLGHLRHVVLNREFWVSEVVLHDGQFLQTHTSDLSEFGENFSELIFSPVVRNTVNVQVGLEFGNLLLDNARNIDGSVCFDFDSLFVRVIGQGFSIHLGLCTFSLASCHEINETKGSGSLIFFLFDLGSEHYTMGWKDFEEFIFIGTFRQVANVHTSLRHKVGKDSTNISLERLSRR
jgi:hypothetical protein